MTKQHKRIPLRLQFFAELEEKDGQAESEQKEESGDAPKTLEDILAENEDLKAQYEAKLAAAEEEAKKKAVEDTKAQVQAEVTEAQKLQDMSAEERAAYEAERRLKDLEAREAALQQRELKVEAVAALKDGGVPESLADILDYTSADACHTSIRLVSTAFQAAVQEAVEAKLKGTAPIKKAPQQPDVEIDEKQIEAAIAGRTLRR